MQRSLNVTLTLLNYERWAVAIGYTHYFQKTEELPQDVWEEDFIPQASQIMKDSGVELGDNFGKVDSKPVINSEVLSFNGIAPDDYETFSLNRMKEDFNCCKTQHRPYDKVIVAILMLAEQCFGGRSGDGFSWSSDGDAEDHKEGKELWYHLQMRATE